MMNNTNTTDAGRKVTVSTTAPWTVFLDGIDLGTFPSRKAAREAAARAKEGASYDDIAPQAHDAVVDAIFADPKAFRQARGWTRAAMASAIGISRYQLDQIERGTKEATSDLFATLAP